MVPDNSNSEFERHEISQEEIDRFFEEQKILSDRFEKESKQQELRSKTTKMALISFALALSTTLTVFVASQIVGLGREKPVDTVFSFLNGADKFARKSDLESVRASTDLMREAFKKAIEVSEEKPELGPVVSLEASFIKAKLEALDQRLSALEKAVSDSPEKALSIPMLRKDQDSLVKAMEANKVVVSAEIARINDLQKWILGGIGTVLVAVIAGLFTALFHVWSKGRDER